MIPRGLLSLCLQSRACTTMHDAVAENADVSVLICADGFPAPHALREHRVDRARELLNGGIGRAAANVHAHHNREGRRRPLAYALHSFPRP